MTITALPAPPEPTDTASEFNTKAFAWVAALDNFVVEVNSGNRRIQRKHRRAP